FDNMNAAEKKKQPEWAEKILGQTDPYPDPKGWLRENGGFQCDGGGHRFTDKLIEEGKGGLLALGKGCQRGRDRSEKPNIHTR
ncbi:hypothetical protein B0O99DRAFT_501086, partial [Bisporella sp. PMI_857]